MIDRFTLQGVTYFQQGRKCGRTACRCATGELHGPYWYARYLGSGKVAYLGRELPDEIERARLAHTRLFSAMQAKQRELTTQIEALSRLLRVEPLTKSDITLLTYMGFSQALVSTMRDPEPDGHKNPNDPKSYAQPILV